MMALCTPPQHFKNPDEAIKQVVFICLRNCAGQCFDPFIKPQDHLTNGAILWRIRQALNTNFIHRFLYVPTKFMKPLVVINAVVSEFFVHGRHFSFAVCHEMSIFSLKHVNCSAQPRAFMFHSLPTRRQ
jgi:hypothetical protein